MQQILMRVGFEPTPVRTRLEVTTLVWRLRPLGHLTIEAVLTYVYWVSDIADCRRSVCLPKAAIALPFWEGEDDVMDPMRLGESASVGI